MAVVELHTGVPTSPKHAPLSDAAFRLWAHALCWSKEHLTDGFVPAAMLSTLHPRGSKVMQELLRVLVPGKGPLWHETEGGYQIHDYDDWQDTKGTVQGRRRQWRERKNRQRQSVGVTVSVPRSVTSDSRVSPTESPSDGVGTRTQKKNPPTPKGASDPLFDRFWKAYPRHTAKAKALKAWVKLEPDASLLEAMLAAIAWQRHQRDWTKDDGAFIPHPATWLNARRWEDEHPDGALNGTVLDEEPVDPRYDLSKPYNPTTRAIPGW